MKIAVIIEGRHPVFGGGQVHVEYLCKCLIENYGDTVDLFTRKLKDTNGKRYAQNQSLLNNMRRIYRIGPTSLYFNPFMRFFHIVYFTFWFFFKAYKERYDIIHAHALLPGIPAKIVGALLHIPVIYTVHGSMHLDIGKRNSNYFIEKYLITKIQYAHEISVSHAIMKYRNVNKNISIIHNGVDIGAFDRVTGVHKHKGFSVVTVGRIDWQKNHIFFLKMLQLIDTALLDKIGFKRKIVGDGPLKDQLIQLATSSGLEKYIDFMGPLFGDKLIEEYKKNHMFVLPSLAEGQPLTILESFAAGIPVLATDVGENSYFIKDNINGFMVSSTDIGELTKTFQKIIQLHCDALTKMGDNGYQIVKNDYDWNVIIDKIHKLYHLVVSNHTTLNAQGK